MKNVIASAVLILTSTAAFAGILGPKTMGSLQYKSALIINNTTVFIGPKIELNGKIMRVAGTVDLKDKEPYFFTTQVCKALGLEPSPSSDTANVSSLTGETIAVLDKEGHFVGTKKGDANDVYNVVADKVVCQTPEGVVFNP